MFISLFFWLYIFGATTELLSMKFNSLKYYLNHIKQLKYPSLQSLLGESKENTLLPSKYNVVLGNEACDADSIISAVCFAYFKSLQCKESEIYVPIVLTSRSNIHMKREVQLLLKSIQLDLNDLVCSDEIPQFDQFSSNHQFTLTLMDHNKLSTQYNTYSSNVIEIIDHHQDLNQYSWVKNEFRNIAFDSITNKALVGSTCTLIAEKYFQNDHISICNDIATLLMGVIALDTINMSPETGIGTERDSNMLQKLQLLSNLNRSILFETLRDAKLDQIFWKQLNILDSLKIDYKLFTTKDNIHRIGFSSILQPISDFVDKENLKLSLNQFINNENLTLLVIMSFVHKPVLKREICIYTNNQYIYELVHQYFLNNQMDHDFQCIINYELINKLKLQIEDDNIYFSIFDQGNVKSSRKQIAPKLVSFHENYLQSNI